MKSFAINIGTVLVDDEDYQKVIEFGNWSGVSGYAANGNNSNRIYMHQLVLGFKSGCIIDHINHNKLDNRKANLRFVSYSANTHNQRRRRTNLSGYTGVSWSSSTQKWRAGIGYNKVHYDLGHFTDKIEAAKAYNRKAIELYGELANINIIE